MSSRSLVGIANRIPAQVLIVTSAQRCCRCSFCLLCRRTGLGRMVARFRWCVGAVRVGSSLARPRPLNPQGRLLFRYRSGLYEFLLLRGHLPHSFGGDSVPGISWPRGGCGVPRPWLGTASCCIFCVVRGLCHWWSGPGFERPANASGVGLGHGGCGLVGGIHRPWTKGRLIELCDDQPFAGLCLQCLDLCANSGPGGDGGIQRPKGFSRGHRLGILVDGFPIQP